MTNASLAPRISFALLTALTLAGCRTYSNVGDAPWVNPYLEHTFGSSEMVPASSRTVGLETKGPSELAELKVDLVALPEDHLQIEYPEDGNVQVEVKLLGPSQEILEKFEDEHVKMGPGSIAILPNTYCFKLDDAGKKPRVAGVCIYSLKIVLPRSSETKLALNGKRLRFTGQPMALEDLTYSLEHLRLDEAPVPLMQEYIASQKAKRFISASDLMNLAPHFSQEGPLATSLPRWQFLVDSFAGHLVDPDQIVRAVTEIKVSHPEMPIPDIGIVQNLSEPGFPIPWEDVIEFLPTLDPFAPSDLLVATVLKSYPKGQPVIDKGLYQKLLATEQARLGGRRDSFERMLTGLVSPDPIHSSNKRFLGGARN